MADHALYSVLDTMRFHGPVTLAAMVFAETMCLSLGISRVIPFPFPLHIVSDGNLSGSVNVCAVTRPPLLRHRHTN